MLCHRCIGTLGCDRANRGCRREELDSEVKSDSVFIQAIIKLNFSFRCTVYMDLIPGVR